jgi:DNA-binding PadR family transcriptional regulator
MDMTPADPRLPLTPLTMAVLLSLAEEDRHGYALMQSVEEQSGGAVRPGTGSLYGALERLLDEGLIAESPEPPPDTRGRKAYRITGQGRALVAAEAARLAAVVRAAVARDVAAPGLLAPDARS